MLTNLLCDHAFTSTPWYRLSLSLLSKWPPLADTAIYPPSIPSTATTPSDSFRPTPGVTGNVLKAPGGYSAPPDALTEDAEGDGLAEMAAWLDTAGHYRYGVRMRYCLLFSEEVKQNSRRTRFRCSG